MYEKLAASTGGPMYYAGRDMKLSHEGMNISESDWDVFIGHAVDTMGALNVPEAEQGEIASFVTSLKQDIVES